MKGIGCLLFILAFITGLKATAQDTARQKKPAFSGKVSQKVMGSIQRTPPPDSVVTIRSEDYFLPYEGKIIRSIIVNQIGFDRVITDTTRSMKNLVTKVANRLHNDSRSWVIRNNLFIREGKPLNPYRVADNERYLRDLDFILDSRIFVLPISEESDSVDLLVMTRDVFSLGATFSPRGVDEYRYRIQEANLGGMGQRLQIAGVFDGNREPKNGHEFLYQKINLFGSFVNASAGYTEINSGRSIGSENEYAYFFRLARPLYSPYARWTGAWEWSRNWSQNNFLTAENAFADYRYSIHDLWVGYSFGLKKLSPVPGENRNRTFIAARAYEQHFSRLPEIAVPVNDRPVYTNRSTWLSQLSFFKQNFYKTQYVLGFGRTEDLPYGYRVSFTGGWEKEQGLSRAYMGAELTWSTVNAEGTFYTYQVKLGNYLREDLAEDALAQFGVSRYSRVYELGKSKVRHQVEVSYAALINSSIKRKLNINDVNGIYGFKPDSLLGTQRLRLHTETVVFTPWKLLGFRLAPVASIDVAYLNAATEQLVQKRNFYSGFSAALRARNENLIFNTVEARIYYYPHTVESLDHWRAEFRVNLRLKYPTNLVSAPATAFDP
jgi:hypothetical protein